MKNALFVLMMCLVMQALGADSSLTKSVHGGLHEGESAATEFDKAIPLDGKPHTFDAKITAGGGGIRSAKVVSVDLKWDEKTSVSTNDPAGFASVTFKGTLAPEDVKDGGYMSKFSGDMVGGGGHGGQGDSTWSFYGHLGNSLELQAEEVDVPSQYQSGKAATTGDGSQNNPKALLAGYFVKAAESDEAKHFVKVKLSAYSNAGLTTQEFADDPEWSVEGGKGDFGSPEDNTGVTVNYRAYQPGKYVFTAKVGSVERTITVYVARTEVLSAPKFIFAEATAKVPIKFGMDSISENFEVDEASFTVYRKPAGQTEWKAVTDSQTQLDTSLEVFGSSWDAQEDENGKHSTYCTVSRSKPFEGLIIRNDVYPYEGTSGMLNGFALEVCVDAKLKLSDDEETNLCTVRRKVEQPFNPFVGTGFTDSRWPVIEIGKDKTFNNGYKCLGGYDRYRHIGSDDNGFACAGFSIPTGKNWHGTPGNFIAGDDERYTGVNAHYHPGDLSHAFGGPRGFDENQGWGADGDHAVAGMTKRMSSTGLTVEARLYDDGDPTSSDDEEEYVAKALAGGISANVLVSYGIKSSSLYGDYMDLGKTESNVAPKALANAQWALTINTAETSWVAQYGGTVTDTIGAALAVVAVIAVLPNPPAWVVAGATYFAAAGAVTATAAVANDIDGFTKYGDQKAMAMMRSIVGTVNWNAGAVPIMHATSNGQGTNPITYDGAGVWGAVATGGVGVKVGDRVCTSFDTVCTAQNESNEWESTADVHSKVELRQNGDAGDLRKVEYTWK